MNAWLGGSGRFFRPAPRLQAVAITPQQPCIVVDDALEDPQALLDWAATQSFGPAQGYPYPGVVLDVPEALAARVSDFFDQHIRNRLGARRTQSTAVRMSLVSVPPGELEPIQWQCHRDRLAAEPDKVLFAAMVLYLFRDPALGGTSFYRPLLQPAQLEQMNSDALAMDAATFGARYGLEAGYMLGGSHHFEHIASLPAAWNRAIFYDGGLFHSADVAPARLSADPRAGRLTLNAFLTCSRRAH